MAPRAHQANQSCRSVAHARTPRRRSPARARRMWSRPPSSDSGIPVEPEIRVGPTCAPADARHRVDEANRFQELEVLVSALPLDTETKRPAIASRKVATVESIGEDRLCMRNLEQIVSLVPPVERVDDDVACCRSDATRFFEH